ILQQQLQEWADQQAHCTEQLEQAQMDLENASIATEQAQARVEEAQAGLPDIETQVREAAAAREEMRVELARLEQSLALAAQSQRDADRQLQALELRRERLEQELHGLNAPDPEALEQLAGDREAIAEQLDQAQGQLVELEDRLPGLDEVRR